MRASSASNQYEIYSNMFLAL